MLAGVRRLAGLSRSNLHTVWSCSRDINVHSLWSFCGLWRCGAPVFTWLQIWPDALDNLWPRHTNESGETLWLISMREPTWPKQLS